MFTKTPKRPESLSYMVDNCWMLKSILLSILVTACVLTPCWGMDGLDTSQAKVLDMVGTWINSAAADVLSRGSEYLTWRSDMMPFLPRPPHL